VGFSVRNWETPMEELIKRLPRMWDETSESPLAGRRWKDLGKGDLLG